MLGMKLASVTKSMFLLEAFTCIFQLRYLASHAHSVLILLSVCTNFSENKNRPRVAVCMYVVSCDPLWQDGLVDLDILPHP